MAALDFRRYHKVFSSPGAPWFSIAGWFGRFPRSALSLSIIICVSSSTGSFQLAGLVSAAFIVAMALAGPMWSRLMDRRGQQSVLIASFCAMTLASVFLAGVAVADAARPWWFAAAIAVGASLADVGAAVRTRWTHLLPVGGRDTAFAVETMVDESVFIVAPPLVTLVASTVSPVLGIVVASGGGVLGGMMLVASRSSLPTPAPADSLQRLTLLPPVVIWPIIASVVGIGAMFGAFDVTAVAWADDTGRAWLTGSLMATMSVGNTIGSLVFGALGWQATLLRRFLIPTALLAVSAVSLPLAPGIVGRHAAVFVVGVITGPVMVSAVALLESRVDHARVTEMLSWHGLGVSAGVPIGGTLGGRAIDATGGTTGSLIVMAAGAVSVALVATCGELLLRLRPASPAASPAGSAPRAPFASPHQPADSSTGRPD